MRTDRFSAPMASIFRAFERLADPFMKTADFPWRETPDPLQIVLYYARSFKYVFLGLAVASALSAIAEVWLMSLLGSLVEALRGTEGGDASGIMRVTNIIAIALIARFVFGCLEDLIVHQSVSTSVTHAIRWESLLNMLKREAAYFRSEASGRLATQTVQLSLAIRNLLIDSLRSLWFMAIFMVTTIILLADVSIIFGAILLAWSLVSAAIFAIFLPRIKAGAIEAADVRSDLTGRIADIFANIVLLKLFSTVEREQSLARDIVAKSLGVARSQMRTLSSFTIAILLLNMTLIGACLWWSLELWMNGQASVGDIAAILTLVIRLHALSTSTLWKMNTVLENWGTLASGVHNFKGVDSRAQSDDAGVEIPSVRGKVEFRNVTFAFGSGSPVVRQVNLVVPQGSKLGIVGASGAGKTTLLNILLGLHKGYEGQVLVDDHDTSQFTDRSLRQYISVVNQDQSVLNRSLRENLQLGVGAVPDERLITALERVHASFFVMSLRDQRGNVGLDAHLGERGTLLSGGERQRISIARAILKEAPIVILDEPTSALDALTEENVQRELSELLSGHTVIAVSHRLSTIAHFDQIVVMDQGKIIEQGRHEELLAAQGMYWRLWERQRGRRDISLIEVTS